MRTPRRRSSLIALLAAGAAGALPATAAAADPTVVFDWSVPARTDKVPGVTGPLDDRVEKLYPSWASPFPNNVSSVAESQFAPAEWRVNVDACDSYSGDRVIDRGRITTFAFTFNGQTLSGPQCRRTLRFPAEGAYPGTVTISDVDGNQTSEDADIKVRDLLVVSLGDSYGSGEGVQPYADNRCDRSMRAAPTQAALRLERGDRSSVTYAHLACSGAKISNGPDETPGHGGLLEGFKGAAPVGDQVLDPQVDELRALVGTRRIDALLLSIGGNDIGFSSLIKSCVARAACHEPGSNANRRFDAAIARLPGLYDALAGALAGWVQPARVYLVGYPDPTKDEAGEYCRWTSGLTIRRRAFRWADQTISRQLQTVMRNAAARHGWQYVEASDDFERHGYCAERAWFTRITESLGSQFDTLGTFHPNAAGQDALADGMVRALRADLAG